MTSRSHGKFFQALGCPVLYRLIKYYIFRWISYGTYFLLQLIYRKVVAQSMPWHNGHLERNKESV